jgi:hypothetical protein
VPSGPRAGCHWKRGLEKSAAPSVQSMRPAHWRNGDAPARIHLDHHTEGVAAYDILRPVRGRRVASQRNLWG